MNKEVFKSWFSHWCAFQFTAIKLNSWRFRFLFHDMEKPFEQILLNHDFVSKWHRKLSRHHAEFIFPKHRDYLGMVIDLECSRLTKPQKQMDAKSTLDKYYPELKNKILPILNKLNLNMDRDKKHMTIDEAIEHCEYNAKKEMYCGNSACSEEHLQLRDWLIELKQLKEREVTK